MEAHTAPKKGPVLLTGATGFVGRHLYPILQSEGYDVICATRSVEKARQTYPSRQWVELDIERPETLRPALTGIKAAFFLIHGMSDDGDYERRERESANNFIQAAEDCGVERIVYLGGVLPKGKLSKHLRSRKVTGEILRSGNVSTIELRAGMIIGAGSESWNIIRDLTARLPAMLLPRWLSYRSEPISIDDVVTALLHALELSQKNSAWYDISGPEQMTGKELILRVSRLRGVAPFTVSVPILSPKLSSYWLRFVTRADFNVAKELVLGFTGDLVASGDVFWDILPGYQLTAFDEAAKIALEESRAQLSPNERMIESILRKLSRKSEASS